MSGRGRLSSAWAGDRWVSTSGSARPRPLSDPAAAPPSRSLVRDELAVGFSLRLQAFVAVSGALGVAAHVVADPMMPAWRLLALAMAAVVVCALPGRRRELSFAGLAGLLVLSQAVVHAVLGLCHCTSTSLVGSVVHRLLCPELLNAEQARWSVDPLLVRPVSAAESPETLGYLAHLSPGAAMLAAHLAAAVLTAWWLRRGEAAAWRAIRSVWPRMASVTCPARVVPPAVRSLARRASVRLRSLVDPYVLHPHRGPPAVA